MIEYIESFLYVISVALLYPVVIGLVLLLCWVVLYTGRFAGEAVDRRKKSFNSVDSFLKFIGTNFEQHVKKSQHPDIEILKTIRSWEEARIKQLNKIRFVVRIGPSLGLMGTLIPMGTALASLSQGDMLAMSSNMVTAFTTTIVGIACGTVAYLVAITKEAWLRKDLQACEIYGEQLLRKLRSEISPVIPEQELETIESVIN